MRDSFFLLEGVGSIRSTRYRVFRSSALRFARWRDSHWRSLSSPAPPKETLQRVSFYFLEGVGSTRSISYQVFRSSTLRLARWRDSHWRSLSSPAPQKESHARLPLHSTQHPRVFPDWAHLRGCPFRLIGEWSSAPRHRSGYGKSRSARRLSPSPRRAY